MDLAGLPYLIETMTPADIPTVAAIERTVFSAPWPEEAFRSELAHHEGACYLVLRYRPWAVSRGDPSRAHLFQRLWPRPALDESLIGYGGYWRVVDEGHICTLAVRHAWRGRGLGELLLLSLIEHALAAGIELMTLEVRVSNTIAQNLYQKYGFERVGRRKGYYGDNGEDAWIMSTASIHSEAYRQMLAERETALRAKLTASNQAPPEPELSPWSKGAPDAPKEKG